MGKKRGLKDRFALTSSSRHVSRVGPSPRESRLTGLCLRNIEEEWTRLASSWKEVLAEWMAPFPPLCPFCGPAATTASAGWLASFLFSAASRVSNCFGYSASFPLHPSNPFESIFPLIPLNSHPIFSQFLSISSFLSSNISDSRSILAQFLPLGEGCRQPEGVSVGRRE